MPLRSVFLPVVAKCLFISYFTEHRYRNNEMHPTNSMLYALRLSINQGTNSLLYKSKNFDRGTATSAAFLATLGLSLSMFSLKQMQSSHQQRLHRRLH